MSLRNIAFLIMFVLCIYGCGQDSTLTEESVAPLQIGFDFAPEAPAQNNITLIELTASAPDFDEPLIFSITNIDNNAHTARGLIQMPVAEDVTLSARAFEGKCPVLSGLLGNLDISSDTSSSTIILSPIQTVIGVRSGQDELNVGSTYSLDVFIEDAPELMYFTCGLEFDEGLIEPLEVAPGDFFGDDALFIQDIELPRREENRLAMGITLKADTAGVCGSGTIFQVTFRTRSSGQARVRLLDSVTLMGSGFEPLEDPARIRIESDSTLKIQ